MPNFNYPKKAAYKLAHDMRKFLKQTESTAYSEINPAADHHRAEVVRQIDWGKFAEIIDQLEFTYLMECKEKGKNPKRMF